MGERVTYKGTLLLAINSQLVDIKHIIKLMKKTGSGKCPKQTHIMVERPLGN